MTFKPKHTTLFILFLVVSTLSLAQVKTTIRGNVVDEKGAPIFAASIYLNNSQGSFSEEDGTFQLSNVVPGSYNLTASFVGFDSQTKFNIIIKSKGNRSFNFILIESSIKDFLLETLKKGFLPIFSATPTINKSHKELAL